MGQAHSNQRQTKSELNITFCGRSWSHRKGPNVSLPLDQIVPAPAGLQPPLPSPQPALPAVLAPPPAPALRPVRWHRAAREYRPAPADRPAPAQAANESPERGRSLQRRPSTTTANPCIAHDTWSPNRSWRSFKEKFLDEPGPVFLQLGEESCPVCYHAYFEFDETRPVRLPCDRQHVMCLQCAKRWLKDGNAVKAAINGCPTCRQVVFRNDGFSSYGMYQAQQDAVLEHIQVMRQNSIEIEEAVAAVWNTLLMRYRDKGFEQA